MLGQPLHVTLRYERPVKRRILGRSYHLHRLTILPWGISRTVEWLPLSVALLPTPSMWHWRILLCYMLFASFYYPFFNPPVVGLLPTPLKSLLHGNNIFWVRSFRSAFLKLRSERNVARTGGTSSALHVSSASAESCDVKWTNKSRQPVVLTPGKHFMWGHRFASRPGNFALRRNCGSQICTFFFFFYLGHFLFRQLSFS